MKYSNNYAIANRRSLMYKFVFPSELITEIIPTNTYDTEVGYKYSGSKITQIGVYYYTTNISSKTTLPVVNGTYSNNVMYFDSVALTNGVLTSKVRSICNYPILFLIEGLSPSTTYHVGGYYVKGGTTYYINGVTVTTKSVSATHLNFNPITINQRALEEHPESVSTLKLQLENLFPIISNMFDDVTNVDETCNPTIGYEVSSIAADASMYFNAFSLSSTSNEVIRSVIIHELEHRWFNPKNNSNSLYSNHNNTIKFMEFATDSENSTWGLLTGHFYPIISSAKFDYLDDYLVVMATDVDILNFNI